MKQMDNTYFDGKTNAMYIQINENNLELIRDISMMDRLLIWTINNKRLDQYNLMNENNLTHYEEKDYNTFIDKILMHKKYKVFYKVSDCFVNEALVIPPSVEGYCKSKKYDLKIIKHLLTKERIVQHELNDNQYIRDRMDSWDSNGYI